MGRHGRSAAQPAPEEAGSTGRHRAGVRPKKRFGAPVRTGLLGASAAMAVGAVAVASGLLPGGDQYTVGGTPTNGDRIRAEGTSDPQQQGGESAEPTDSPAASPSGTTSRPHAPSTSPSPKVPKPSATHSKAPKPPAGPPQVKKTQAPPRTAPAPTPTEERAVTPAAPSSQENAVLALVNQERAKVGCSALRADPSLGSLAQNFSDDMADRGFFDHTDPDGKTPWDRADAAGVKNLGGENIARGQADAQAVMDSWMNSEGHRANILNCDYTRLGVGEHTGSGGPWWTQDFGF